VLRSVHKLWLRKERVHGSSQNLQGTYIDVINFSWNSDGDTGLNPQTQQIRVFMRSQKLIVEGPILGSKSTPQTKCIVEILYTSVCPVCSHMAFQILYCRCQRNIFEVGTQRWKVSSAVGGLGGCAPQTLTPFLQLYISEFQFCMILHWLYIWTCNALDPAIDLACSSSFELEWMAKSFFISTNMLAWL